MSSEYHWQWTRPDRPGVWARSMNGEQKCPNGLTDLVTVYDPSLRGTGWWCFLIDLPTILPPKKKVVWRMWVSPDHTSLNILRMFGWWVPDGEKPSRADAIRTDATEERDE